MSKQLILAREHLLALLGQPAFYQACPEFQDLIDDVQAVYRQIEESPRKGCCGDGIKLAYPVLDKLVARLHALKTSNPQALDRLREYVGRRKGQPGQPILVYYRKSLKGRADRLTF